MATATAQQVGQVSVPPLSERSVLVAGYDPSDGSLRLLNLGTLHEAQVLAEQAHVRDVLDGRNGVAVTIPAGTAIGTILAGTIEVPAEEVWYLNRLSLTTPADVTGNILVSSFPKTLAGTDKAYLETDQAAAASVDYDLEAAGRLGAQLRLVGGDKLTARATVTGIPGADVTLTLDLFGFKGKKLV